MKDLSNLKTFIIDSEDPKEIDDAVSLEICEGNKQYIWIHISYPSKLFSFNSDEDIKARNNCSSLYLIDKYIPMLSKEIIKKANLERNKLSETISACIELNTNGSIKSYELMEALIKPNYQITFEEANEIIDLAPREEIELLTLNKLLKSSTEFRKRNGAIIFDTPYSKILFDNGKVSFKKIYKTEAHHLISESMILMGYVISDYLNQRGISGPFRTQKLNCNPKEILDRNFDSPIKYSILKQYIGKSYISIKPGIHETLALKTYVQATSPLRRYLDLLIQRQLYLSFNKLEILSEIKVNEIIEKIKLKNIENNNIIKENKNYFLKKYFNTDNVNLHKILFIRWINNKKNIALVYFPDLNLETLINLYISAETYPNKLYKVKYENNENSNLLDFLN